MKRRGAKMIREIVKDPIFLAQKSKEATISDSGTAADLLDTIKANADRCVGMAANMIGVNKRIIVFEYKGGYEVMYNPEIIRKEEKYESEEGCLSLSGTRKTTRYRVIRVQYQNDKMQLRIKTYDGFTAKIIQHEIDHCDGILI